MGVDETWDQKFPLRQTEHLDLSAVSDRPQEFMGGWFDARCELKDSFDNPIVVHIGIRIWTSIIRVLVDGGDDRTADEERHCTV